MSYTCQITIFSKELGGAYTQVIELAEKFKMTAKKLGETCNEDGECGQNAKCDKNGCKCKASDGY